MRSYLHMIHHKLVRQSTPRLGVLYFFVYEAVHDGYSAINAERIGHLLVEVIEMPADFVTKLRHSDYTVFVSDRETKYIPSFKARCFVHALVK